MLDCGTSCIKYLIFIFNFMFAVSGICLIVVGACVLHDVDRFRNFLEDTFLAPPIVFIIVGIVVFIVAFMGCCGAIRESPCMLVLFAGILFLILAAQITVGIISSANRSVFIEGLRKSMQHSKDNYNPAIPQERKLWDDIQYGLKCCGVEGPDDWQMGGVYPASCCEGYNPKIHNDHLCKLREFVYEDGCYDKLKERLIEDSHIVLGVSIGLAFIQFTGIVLACVLASEITNERRKENRA